MNRSPRALLILLALSLGGVYAQTPAEAPRAPVAVAADYRLGVDDVIAVDVARHPDVSRTVRLPVDGQLRLPRLRSPLAAQGRTCAELVAVLEQRFRDEGGLRLRPGQVQVSVVGIRVRRIYVRGNAVGGRELDLRNGWRISELLAAIGGLPPADRVIARLTHPERPAALALDLPAILADPGSVENIALQEGDTLTIDLPRSKRIFVTGEGPRGMHEVDERFGLRRVLLQFGITPNFPSADLRRAVLRRKQVPGDPNSAETQQPVDLLRLLTDQNAPEIPLRDMDTIDVPPSENYVYLYGADGRVWRWLIPQDRKVRLMDVFTNAGGVPGPGKLGGIVVWRYDGEKPVRRTYDIGKFLKDGNMEQNPEIHAQDIIVVPSLRRVDPFQALWQAVGAVQALTFLRSTFLK